MIRHIEKSHIKKEEDQEQIDFLTAFNESLRSEYGNRPRNKTVEKGKSNGPNEQTQPQTLILGPGGMYVV